MERQSRMLADAEIPHVVLSGSPPERGSSLPFRTIEGLDYALVQPDGSSKFTLLERMLAAATEALGQALPLNAGDDAQAVRWVDVGGPEHATLYADHKEWVDRAEAP